MKKTAVKTAAKAKQVKRVPRKKAAGESLAAKKRSSAASAAKKRTGGGASVNAKRATGRATTAAGTRKASRAEVAPKAARGKAAKKDLKVTGGAGGRAGGAGKARPSVKAASTLVKRVAGKNTTGKRAAVKGTSMRKVSPSKPSSAGAAPEKLHAKDRKDLLDMLLALRQRLTDHVAALKDESLKRNDAVVSPEDGTDVFDRQFALSLASNENEAIFEIDEALRRLDTGEYGVCEECSEIIGKARLMALPFVRTCVKCQAEREKGKSRFRVMAE